MSQYPNYFGHNTHQTGQAVYNTYQQSQGHSYPTSTASSQYQHTATASGNSYGSNPWYRADGNHTAYGTSVGAPRISNSDQTRTTSIRTSGLPQYNLSLNNSGYATNICTTDPLGNTTSYGSSANTTRQPQMQYSTTQDYSVAQNAYAGQARPPSVNSVSSGRVTSHQRQSPSVHDRQQHEQSQHAISNLQQPQRVQDPIQRSTSPAQLQASRNLQNVSRGYGDQWLISRTLPAVTQPASSMHPSLFAPVEPQAITVDPTQVYDPRAEHQRRLEAARLQAAEEEATRAAQEDEEKRLAQEAEEKKQAEGAERARKEAERKAEEAWRIKTAEPKKKKTQKKKPVEEDDAAQFMALVARMKEKNPSLLAQMLSETKTDLSPAASSTAPKQSSKPLGGFGAANRAKPLPAQARPTPAPALPCPTIPTSTPIPGQKSTRPPGTTVWPIEKKGKISEAAAQYLNGIPTNAGNPVTKELVHAMLDDNPSYIGLCDRLERMGLRLERGTFARTLLSAAPDVNAAAPQKTAAPHGVASPTIPPPIPLQPHTQATPWLPSAQDISSFPHPGQGGPAYGEPSQGVIQSPYFVNRPEPSPGIASSVDSPASSKPRTKVTTLPKPIRLDEKHPVKPPATKEEAARKRNFSEIADLSMMSSDEDDLPPLKMMKLAPYTVQYATQPPYPRPNQGQVVNGASNIDPQIQSQADQNGQMHMVMNAPTLASNTYRPHISDDVKLADPIQRQDAIRRSHYNVKTIARDVLIATGKWPDLRALNYHLEPLRQNMRQIDGNSDLSTLHWNIIDPGEPDDLQQDNADSVISDADDEGEETVNMNVLVPREQSVTTVGSAESARPHHVGIKPRRGRPPPAGRRQAPGSHFVNYSDSARPSAHLSQPNPKPKPQAINNSPGPAGGMGYAAFRSHQVDADGNPVKKKGRPVGWRKSIHSKAVQGQHHSGPPSQAATNSGAVHSPHLARIGTGGILMVNARLGQHESPAAAKRLRSPGRLEFACRWKGCGASLHNLETLKKHVLKMHGKPDEASRKFACAWQGCGKYPELSTFPLFWQHIDDSHLIPLSWTHGDGPVSGVSDYDTELSDVYLRDSRGRQVTPRISLSDNFGETPISHRPVPRPRPPRRPPLHGPGKKTPEEKASESVQVLERKKELIGPGIDKGGATLANEKRRAGFIDDAGFEEEVDSD
ncbi:hypothetical protein P152DRAFT_475563 [Eremomyces bilateralis CBS 781.70]|uniref:C2H2-type domain-containing protein n=1 Tax=Eremomyces bilateralis CBS 781.70 TaxID=1392243 RepID=A0A6G1FX32_9PEZI|nr:uncharacterized protein P152DRAFT_475563 [Eremomyces bilateralis CBS 781.70]KAF1810334.1 hypothetical protein P152DRAFT_475563 [Eremomyces bilateralis CBS 781.70]